MENALNQNDILFNLISLKHKFLLPDQICENCKQITNIWIIIGVCHDIICHKCVDVENGTTCCPVCKKMFNLEQHVTSNLEMKLAYCQMEEFIWKILALNSENEFNENKVLNNYTEEKNSEEMEILLDNLNKYKQINIDDNEHEKQNIITEYQNQVESCVSNLLPSYVSYSHQELTEVKFEELLLTNNLPRKFEPICLNLNKEEDNPKKKLIDESSKHSISKLSAFKNFKLNNSIIVNCNKSTNNAEKNDLRDEQDVVILEKDVIEGTPEKLTEVQPIYSQKCHIAEKSLNKSMVLTYSNLDTDDELIWLKKFMSLFDVCVYSSWIDIVTHLIVKTNDDGTSPRTKKCMNALLSNCVIVTLKWVEDCVKSQSLLAEVDYMPLETSGEPSPMLSWKVGQGIIDSPMTWAMDCIIYVHSSIKANDDFTDILNGIKKVGFILADSIDEINTKYNIRIILVDVVLVDGKRVELPNKDAMIGWIYNSKAVTVYWDWMLECLFRYKFIKIEPKYQALPLTPLMVEQAQMSKLLFKLNDSQAI